MNHRQDRRHATAGQHIPKNLLIDTILLYSPLDSIAVSLFVDWMSLSNTEANPNNNLLMDTTQLNSPGNL